VTALAAAPDAILASPKTTCAARPTFFERIMAAPYGVDFPNLSGQLYAARAAGLPPRMPEDLIEPERWLELAIGTARMVRDPEALVVVRLPGSLRDFYRQRIRIEMGKVQLERDYPELAARGNAQPRLRTAVTSLGVAGPAPARRVSRAPRERARGRAPPLRTPDDGRRVGAGGQHEGVDLLKALALVTRLPVPPWRGDQVGPTITCGSSPAGTT
jgi:hypothetical protein